MFEDGKLVRVNFAHKDVHSPYDWQAEKDPVKQEEKRKEGVPTCEFSLPKCRALVAPGPAQEEAWQTASILLPSGSSTKAA